MAAEEQISPPVIHHLIRAHPANGRKPLYVGFHASHIDGMSEKKGRAELFRLLDFATQDRFVYAHKWRAGDLVVWDNPSLVHKSAPFMKYKERVIYTALSRAGQSRSSEKNYYIAFF